MPICKECIIEVRTLRWRLHQRFLLDSCVIVFMASAEEVMGHSYAKIKFVKFHSH